jgi:hypothetical protein
METSEVGAVDRPEVAFASLGEMVFGCNETQFRTYLPRCASLVEATGTLEGALVDNLPFGHVSKVSITVDTVDFLVRDKGLRSELGRIPLGRGIQDGLLKESRDVLGGGLRPDDGAVVKKILCALGPDVAVLSAKGHELFSEILKMV